MARTCGSSPRPTNLWDDMFSTLDTERSLMDTDIVETPASTADESVKANEGGLRSSPQHVRKIEYAQN